MEGCVMFKFAFFCILSLVSCQKSSKEVNDYSFSYCCGTYEIVNCENLNSIIEGTLILSIDNTFSFKYQTITESKEEVVGTFDLRKDEDEMAKYNSKLGNISASYKIDFIVESNTPITQEYRITAFVENLAGYKLYRHSKPNKKNTYLTINYYGAQSYVDEYGNSFTACYPEFNLV